MEIKIQVRVYEMVDSPPAINKRRATEWPACVLNWVFLVPRFALPFAGAGLIATLTPATAPVLVLVIPSVIAPGFAPGLGFLAALLLIALGHGGFAGEFHAAFLVHAEAFDPDFIAHLNNVFSRLAE